MDSHSHNSWVRKEEEEEKENEEEEEEGDSYMTAVTTVL